LKPEDKSGGHIGTQMDWER